MHDSSRINDMHILANLSKNPGNGMKSGLLDITLTSECNDAIFVASSQILMEQNNVLFHHNKIYGKPTDINLLLHVLVSHQSDILCEIFA